MYHACHNLALPGTTRCVEHPLPKKESHTTDSIRKRVRELYDGKCAICGKPGTEVDHIIELSEFQPHEKYLANRLDNLQLLCFEHHVQKTTAFNQRFAPTDPNDFSVSARARKRRRMRQQGFEV